jgi:PAS domain S-box-containing protein
MPRTLFSTEEKIIYTTEQLLTDEAHAENPLLKDVKDLLNKYKKLYKQSSRLIKMSDRQQEQLRNAEAALRKSEEKYRGLYNSSIDGIVYSDMNNRVLEANPSFLDMISYTSEEIKEIVITDLIPPKWHDMINDIKTNQILTRGRTDEYEQEIIDKYGNCISVSICSWLIRDDKENPVGIWSIIRDISERKRAEQLKADVERMVRHDLKTPLNGVIGLSQQLLQTIEQEAQIAEKLEKKIQTVLSAV